MDDDILKEDEEEGSLDDELEIKKKEPLDDAESVEDLVEEETDEVEPFDDLDLT